MVRFISLAPEFGSTTSAWKALMSEADASADVHQTVHDELQNDVIPAVKSWQKNKYIKSMMHIKCTKEFDEDFKRVCFDVDQWLDIVSLLLYLGAKAMG
jgi:hypothetical protein